MTTLAFLDNWLVPILVVVFLIVSIVLILVVLIQRPQGGGLVGAFGSGAGSGQTAFGAKTGDALTLTTIAIFLLYLMVAVGLNWSVTPSEPTEAFAGAPAGVTDEPQEQSPPPEQPQEGAGAPQQGEDDGATPPDETQEPAPPDDGAGEGEPDASPDGGSNGDGA